MAGKSLVYLLSAITGFALAQSTFTPARPPAVPLAVKSPYLSTWLQAGSDGGNGGYLAGEWPTFWRGAVTGWAGIVRVDGQSYTWMGAPLAPSALPSVTQNSFEYTATSSIFKQQINNTVALTVTFLSPVTPNDYLRASLPFSYLNVEVSSIDGAEHEVQLYTDISAEWVSGDRGSIAQWDYGVISTPGSPLQAPIQSSSATEPQVVPEEYSTLATRTSYDGWRTAVPHTEKPNSYQSLASTNSIHQQVDPQPTALPKSSYVYPVGGVAYHNVYKQTQLAFSENTDQTEYGNWYYLTNNTASLTYQSGIDLDVRGQFVQNGDLSNAEDTNYRAISDQYPVFGFAFDMGNVSSDPQTALFGLSLNQQEAIQFEGANGVQPVPSLWTSYFGTDFDAISWFFNDYETVSSIASDFDNQVQSDSVLAAGDDYATITTLAARQAFAGTQLVGTNDTQYVFLKEISSDGNVNTVDAIFPMHPILVYTNPTLLKLLLEPLFINQEAGNWPLAFSIHDIGSSYPNATGHNDGNAEQQPLEECGNMIIMALAYAQRANDNEWLSSHYGILKQWNEYLVEEALIPANQISTDDFAGSLANQTNLAIKGIVGIAAMAQIANRTGNSVDSANYTQIAQNYVSQWQGYGINSNANPPHATLSYGNDSSWGLLYNLFGDRELGLQLVPQSVYDMQSAFYPTVFGEYGVPLDTRHTYTKGDWEIFMASVSSNDTRDQFIHAIANWINVTPTNHAFTDLYDTVSGDYPGITFIARPVIGGEFAILALNSAPTDA